MSETKDYKVYPLYKDLMFKYIFGTNKNIIFAKSLLESFFKLQNILNNLEGINVKNSIKLDKTSIDKKGFEMDVVIELGDKELLNLEMYTNFDVNAMIKSLMYVSSKFSNELDAGEEYDKASKITQINFVKGKKGEMGEFCLINKLNVNETMLEDLFKIYVVNVDEVKTSDEEFFKWTRFIAAETPEEMESAIEGNEIMMQAYEKMKLFSNEGWVKGYFNKERLIKSQHNTELNQKVKESFNSGKAEGENNRSIEIAENMLKDGFDYDTITKYTKLSKEEIEALK